MAGYNQLVTCILCFFSVAPNFARGRVPSVLKLFPGDHNNYNQLELVEENGQRFLHAVYRVGDLNRTIEFYKVCFGMQLLTQVDTPNLNYSYAIVGYGPQESNFFLKLIYNYGADSIDVGTGFGHFGVVTRDVYQTVDNVVANGGVVTREPSPSSGGSVIYAFVVDPNGYTFEVTQIDPTPESFDHLNFIVTDMNRSIDFYERALGMRLLSSFDIPNAFTIVTMGYGERFQTTVLELTYNYGITDQYTKGNGYSHVAISTDDVYKSVEIVTSVTQELGGEIIRPPGPVAGMNANITSFLDPEGFEIVLVENKNVLINQM